jgi:hypothetical protein
MTSLAGVVIVPHDSLACNVVETIKSRQPFGRLDRI